MPYHSSNRSMALAVTILSNESSEGKMEITFVLRLSCLLMLSMIFDVLRRFCTSGGQSMTVRHCSMLFSSQSTNHRSQLHLQPSGAVDTGCGRCRHSHYWLQHLRRAGSRQPHRQQRRPPHHRDAGHLRTQHRLHLQQGWRDTTNRHNRLWSRRTYCQHRLPPQRRRTTLHLQLPARLKPLAAALHAQRRDPDASL